MLLKRLEDWCKANNTNISKLESKCGLGNATIRGWSKSVPRADILLKVAAVTGIPINELVDCICKNNTSNEEECK